MLLTRHDGGYWAVDGKALPPGVSLATLLTVPRDAMHAELIGGDPIASPPTAPCEPGQEVWASGVTYLRSRQEREAESTVADVYAKVYDADRPELFFKAAGWRVVGPESPIRIRRDSDWNVPEPEMTLVINRFGEIVGYTAGNDVSSRSIEGENPLYLPQAKSYDGSCALGPAIHLVDSDVLRSLEIRLDILRDGERIFFGETSTAMMRRTPEELVGYLFRETSFPNGVFLMTGTGIVPAHPFSLQSGDTVKIDVGELTLVNQVHPD